MTPPWLLLITAPVVAGACLAEIIHGLRYAQNERQFWWRVVGNCAGVLAALIFICI